MIRRTVLIASTLGLLAACEKPAPAVTPGNAAPGSPPPMAAPATPAPTKAVAAPAKPVGPARTVQPVAEDDNALYAANVTEVHGMADQGAKIFSTAGGDPAVNGLYTYLALYQNNAEGWRVFMLGDFESWKVIEEGRGRVVIHYEQSGVDQATGTIARADGKIIVEWAGDGATSVKVTPAG